MELLGKSAPYNAANSAQTTSAAVVFTKKYNKEDKHTNPGAVQLCNCQNMLFEFEQTGDEGKLQSSGQA